MLTGTKVYDWSAVAAWIALVISVVTPSISLFLNNIHQRKLKKLELKHALILDQYNQMESAIIEYHKCVSAKLFSISMGSSLYDLAYRKLFLFVPGEYWKMLEDFNKLILSSKDTNLIHEEYLKITEILASLLQELRKQIPA